jgi:hypothetical protein
MEHCGLRVEELFPSPIDNPQSAFRIAQLKCCLLSRHARAPLPPLTVSFGAMAFSRGSKALGSFDIFRIFTGGIFLAGEPRWIGRPYAELAAGKCFHVRVGHRFSSLSMRKEDIV